MRLGLRSTFGMLLLGIAAVFLLAEFVALTDPMATQMANDADPFGTPPGWKVHAMWLGIGAALSAAGLWMILGGRRKRNPPIHQRNRG
jgi:Na+-driven multidrug efflux pump